MGGDALSPLDDPVGRGAERRAADRRGARAEAAAAERDLVGVALDHADPLERQAEPVVQHLRVHRLVALAVGEGARHDGRVAGRIEADLHPVGDRRAHLDVETEPAAAPQASCLGRRPPRGKAVPVGERARGVEDRLELAAIVGLAHCGLVRRDRDEVAPAQGDRIDAELARGLVERALDEIDRLRPAGAAVGRQRPRMRQHAAHGRVHRRDRVHARQHPRADQRRMRARRPDLAAEVVVGGHAEPEDLSVGVERHLGVRELVAAVEVGEERFAAVRDPFHRPPDPPRRPQHGDLLGVEAALGAEAAADVARDDVDAVRRHLEDVLREELPDAVRVRGRGDEPPARFAAVERADAAARLERVAGDPLVQDAQPRDVRRIRERGGGLRAVAELVLEADVVGPPRPDRRRAVGDRRFDRRRGGGRLVFDRYEVCGVERLRPGLRDDDRDLAADALHAVAGEGGEGRPEPLAAHHRRRNAHAGNVAERIGGEVGAGEHRDHAGRRERRGDARPTGSARSREAIGRTPRAPRRGRPSRPRSARCPRASAGPRCAAPGGRCPDRGSRRSCGRYAAT